MSLTDLGSWLRSAVAGEEAEITDRARTLAEGARSDRITPALLAKPGSRTNEPLVTYVEDDEQPQYVFRGSHLLIEDDADALTREHPSLELAVLVTDRRVLFVVGGRLSDAIYEVPLSDVELIYLDEARSRRHFVVEAVRDGDPMTFFADVTLDRHVEALGESVEYVRSCV